MGAGLLLSVAVLVFHSTGKTQIENMYSVTVSEKTY